MKGQLIFEHTSSGALFILLGILSVTLLVFTAQRYLPRKLSTLLLIGLRLLFMMLLGWCLLMPVWKRTRLETFPPRFLIALDTSASMSLAPTPEQTNRWVQAQSVLRQACLQALGTQALMTCYSFAEDLSTHASLGEYQALTPNGSSTSLRNSLQKLSERHRGQNICGLLLLSDGLDTREASDDWASAPWPFPIYTVRPETPGIWHKETDVRVEGVETPRRVVKGWDSELKVMVSGQGTGGQAIGVQLYSNERLLQELPLDLAEDGGTRSVAFRLQHPDIGNFAYTVFIPPLPNETRTNDNSFTVSIQVTDTKNRLLYLEGTPRYESKFLVRALQQTPEITPVCLMRGPEGRFLTYGTQSTAPADISAEILAHFKIVILGDLNAEELGATRAQALLKFVEAGGSLVLLGGNRAWSKEGFTASPLRLILPIRQAAGLTLREGNFNLSLTSEGRTHPAFLASDQQTPWIQIPPVLSLFRGAELAPGAIKLIASDPEGDPLLIAQHYGQGKVAAILTDSLWRWQLNPGREEPYQQFWNQFLFWLSPSAGEIEEHQLELSAEFEQLFLGDELELRAQLTGLENIATKASVTCEIKGPDDRRLPFPMTQHELTTTTGMKFKGFALRFMPPVPGFYEAVAQAQFNGHKINSAPYSFFIKPFAPELNPRPANVEILQELAWASQGQFCEPDQLCDALATLKLQSSAEERLDFISLWNRLPILACLMVLLALEWIVRKRKNMA